MANAIPMLSGFNTSVTLDENTVNSVSQLIDADVTSGGCTSGRPVAELVFIDSRVPDVDVLLRGLNPAVEAYVLDPAIDGVAQVTAALGRRQASDLSAISLVAHGAPGEIHLGATVLDAHALPRHADALAVIGAALAPSGTLKLYGCEVGSGAVGARFIAALSRTAGGIDVAAATQPIGDGQWSLDAAARRDAVPPFAMATLESYRGLLPTVVWDQSSLKAQGSKQISGYVAANDFTLTAAQRLLGATVWLADNENNNNGQLDSFNGTIGWAIYSNDGGKPGALLYSGQDTAPVLTDTGQQDGTNYDVVKVDFSFAGQINLVAGSYWFALHEGDWGSGNDGSKTFWMETTTPVGHSRNEALATPSPGNWAEVSFDPAFVIRGDGSNAPVIVLKPTPDIVTANFLSDDVSVLLGNGSGGFAAAVGSPVAADFAPVAVAVGDLNGDGDLDIVAANQFSDNVSVLLGNGAGGFAAAAGSPIATGDASRAVALGDLDGDGDLDIVTANGGSDAVSVLLGDGTGGFAAASPAEVGDNPGSVALGDLDGDGDLDIVTANVGSDDVSVLLGDGTGGFAAAGPVVVGDAPIAVALGDLDGDGDLDIVTANISSDNVSVLLGNGAGGFVAAAGSPVAAIDNPVSVALGDVNGDGDLDIVTANALSDNVSVLLGNGTGGFVAAAGSPVAAGDSPRAVALRDLDGDGDLDIVAANQASDDVSVLLGDGTGGFAAAAGSAVAAGDGAHSVALGDFNPLDEVSLTDTLAFTEGVARLLLPQIMVADPDGATLASATLTISGGFAGSGDVLAAVTTGTGITASFNIGAGVLSLTGTASIANYIKVLRGVTFASGDDPTHGGANASRTVTLTVDDGGASGTSAAATVTLNVTAQNDAPVAGNVTLPSIQVNSGAHIIAQAQLLANTTDPDSSALTVTGVSIGTSPGSLVDNGNGTWTYAPKINDDTEVTLAFTVSDGQASENGQAKLDITPVQAAPEIGTPGDDTFTAVTGNATYIGLGGIDTINFDFKLTDATVSHVGNTVVIDGPTSHTILNGFERFVFTDGTVNNADGSTLIDDLFYYSRHHDVWAAKVDADLHYNVAGWKEGRDPSAFFDISIYLSANPDVATAGVNPLTHYDAIGWKEGRIPSPEFDGRAYLDANPDVTAAHIDPLWHFLATGASEGRQPIKSTELIAANGFDFVYYLANNPDVAAPGVDPFWHFQNIGWKEGRDPNALFDVSGYLTAYTDVAAASINPLDHYHQSGWHEGRDPSLGFDTTSYLAANTDVAAAKIDPLMHFLHIGQHEGRSALADGVWG